MPPTRSSTVAAPRVALRRELGRWDLTAIGVNQVIGSAVFAVPAIVAAQAGAWSPWIVAGVGLASLMIALCFAEVGSRFDGTGGPYLYTRAAFGRFPAFEVGWMMWFTRAASWAAVVNVLAISVGFYWPAVTAGWPRAALISTIVAALAAINVRGIRQSSIVLNTLTIGKLLPLAVFIAIGLFFVEPARLVADGGVTTAGLSASALALIFAFGGYEVVPVPAGEARDPRHGVPFALVMTLVLVTVVMTLVQVVAVGTLPGLAGSTTPLADAAVVFMGGAGAAMITIAAVISTLGNNVGQALSGSRNLYALAEQGDLPRVFGHIHRRFHTPDVAIAATAGVSLVLALSGTFGPLALVSAVSRLIVYLATCAATLKLRRSAFSGRVAPATFVVPFGPVIPAAAIVIALAILAGARWEQLVAGAVALAVGAVLYWIAVLRREAPMKRLVGAFLLTFTWTAAVSAQSAVFLVRHAERADAGAPPGGAATMMAPDPDLSEAGKARAASLAAMLKDAKITAIYVTEYKRTRQTAEPLSRQLGIEMTVVPSKDAAGLTAKLKSARGNVLVVGHSNTVPATIAALGVQDPVAIGDTDYDDLFIVLASPQPQLMRLHYR